MNCWHCDRPAHGACSFCGRGVCKEHYRSMPGLLEMFRDRLGTLRGFVVDSVLWCGVCTPKRYPVNLDAIDPAQAGAFEQESPAEAPLEQEADTPEGPSHPPEADKAQHSQESTE